MRGKHSDDVDSIGHDEDSTPAETVSDSECTSTGQSRILVIEDHSATRQAMVKLLIRNGYDATGVSTALEARTLLASSVPDIIILDLGLPDTDGVSLAREFRGNLDLCDTRLICVSGSTIETTVENEQLFDACLLKPVELATLIKAITSLQSL